MNFLAHFHLAWPSPGLVVGGLEGDYYKGPLRGDLPRDIEHGVRLHRAIDAYTDTHSILTELKGEFPTGLRRYAGILIDLSFDHFLSIHWSRFAEVPLSEFNSEIYSTLHQHRQHLSEGSQRMLGRLVEHDLLGLYLDWETVPASAERIGQRFRRENPFVGIQRELVSQRDRLEQAFLAFYPDVQAYSLDCQIRLNAGDTARSKTALQHTAQPRTSIAPC